MAKRFGTAKPTHTIEIFRQPDCILPKSFFEGRFIPNFHPESLDYEQWWTEQTRRCVEGWKDGGFFVTPEYYYHLNLKKINMLDMKTLIPGWYNPYFSYEDQQLFNDFDEAKKNQEGFFLITGRGFGKCLAKGTKVLMYDGRLLEIEKIKRGDKVMGPDSKSRNVLSTTCGVDDMYEVVQSQGISYTVNSLHLLYIVREGLNPTTVSAKEFASGRYNTQGYCGIKVDENYNYKTTGDLNIYYRGQGEYYGFSLDGDHLFLLEDKTITHNSFNVATLVEHKFTFQDTSEVMVTASTDKFANLLWEKITMGLNSQPEDIRRGTKVDTTGLKQSGYEEKDPITNRYKWYDEKGFIRKVVYDSDPEKTRGTRPDIHVWEEVGSWTGAASLIDCYKKSEPSWWRGGIKTTFPIFIGTGGAMDTGGSVDAKLIFNAPEEFGIKPYIYEGEKIGKFIPAYKKFTSFYEKSGESDEIGAKDFLDKRREKKKKNPDLYRQETSEFPYNPVEAFQTNGAGIFPIDLLEKRYVEIERNPSIKKLVQKGNLDWMHEGSKIVGVKWNPTAEGDPWTFEIAEHPAWTKSDWRDGMNRDMYISGCDSFDAAAEDSISKDKSPGSIIVYKRFYDITVPSRFFVAKCTQRTEDATEFYWNTIKLNLYYNCRMLAEYTKVGIFQHYITKSFEYILYKRPRLDKTVLKESVSTNTYGLAMPEQIKRHVIFNFKSFTLEPGTIDQFYFQSLIRDMLSFSFEGRDKNKHDETMAAALALMGDADMYKVSAKKQETSSVTWPTFRRNASGGLVFE